MKRLAILLLATGCLGPGAGFLELEPRVVARYQQRPERTIPSGEPGWQKLASEHQLQVTSGSVEVAGIELVAAGSASAKFDPASPPPGWGPCHNGHCHAPDGRLVPYDEVAAETGGGGGPTVVARLGGGSWDLLAGAPVMVTCDPCTLGRTPITRARISFGRLRLDGMVRDGPGVPAPIGSLPVGLDAAGSALAPILVPLDLPADNQHPPRTTLTLTIELDAGLLDDVPWAMFAAQARADLATPAALATVRERLAAARVHVEVARR